MSPNPLSLILLLLLVPICVLAQTSSRSVSIEDRTPAYFVDRYGPAKSSRNVAQHGFVHPTRGSINVKGQFSTRAFQSDDLRVQAVFHLPSLRLAAVTLRLPRSWTAEQIQAALNAYAADWKPSGPPSIIKTWTTPRGDKAIFLLSSLEIQTAPIAQSVEAAIRESDAKRKAVPKF